MAENIKKQDRPLILIVDDEPPNMEFLCNILRKDEYQLSMAGNGREALERVGNIRPDLILLDVKMPEMDGFEVCKKLKESPETRDIPIIFITVKDDVKDVVAGLQLGAVDYLIKPYNAAELTARVRTHVDLKKSKDEIIRINKKLETAYHTLEKELSEAGAYVESMLPAPLKNNPRIDWRFKASGKLGGDIFGYNWLDENHFAVYLLDVKGHGVGAAFMSVSIMKILHCQTLENTDFRNPAAVLASLNDKKQSHRPFSIWYGIYSRTGHCLIYSGAGHPPALLFTGANPEKATVKKLETPGPAVGITPGSRYQNNEIHLESFTRLLLFSNGAYKIKKKSDNEMWSLQECLHFLEEAGRSSSLDLDQLVQHIQELKAVPQWDDDFALLSVEFKHEK